MFPAVGWHHGLGFDSCPRNLEDTTVWQQNKDGWLEINLHSQNLSGQKEYELDIGHEVEKTYLEVFFFSFFFF